MWTRLRASWGDQGATVDEPPDAAAWQWPLGVVAGAEARSAFMVIDELMPRYDVSARHSIKVHAPVDLVDRALRAVDFGESKVTRRLLTLRSLPGMTVGAPWTGRDGASPDAPAPARPSSRLTLIGMLDRGFAVLVDRPKQEVVLGTVGRFWEPRPQLRALDAEAFARFDEPGVAKAIWSFTFSPLGNDYTRLTTETRVACPDSWSRTRFRLYWAGIGVFSGVLRREILRLVQERAEKYALYHTVQGG